MSNNIIQDKVTALAKARAKFESAKDALDKFLSDNETYNVLLSDVAQATEARVSADEDLRKTVTDQYTVDGNTEPHPAIKIKQYQSIYYEDDPALLYCRTEMPQALRVDKPTFAKMLKALPYDRRPDFVEITVEARPNIAKDLSPYISGRNNDRE